MDESISAEDPEDRRIRLAHGFTIEDDFEDRTILCNTCRRSYYDIATNKVGFCKPKHRRPRTEAEAFNFLAEDLNHIFEYMGDEINRLFTEMDERIRRLEEK